MDILTTKSTAISIGECYNGCDHRNDQNPRYHF